MYIYIYIYIERERERETERERERERDFTCAQSLISLLRLSKRREGTAD